MVEITVEKRAKNGMEILPEERHWTKPTFRGANPHSFAHGLAFISLTDGLTAIVDVDDYPLVAGKKWKVEKAGDIGERIFYAVTGIAHLSMHRLIAGVLGVDHRNGDGLDNRRCNLRTCTQQQNTYNKRKTTRPCTSQYKGVRYHSRGKSFLACIAANGKREHLGSFKDEEAAARAYDAKARELHGEFARCNFQEDRA